MAIGRVGPAFHQPLAGVHCVGVGSVCRRQGTKEAIEIFAEIHGSGIANLHGFGLKTEGLRGCWPYLQSSDSLAWSAAARFDDPMEGHSHKKCANCLEYALLWRERALRNVGRDCDGFLNFGSEHED